MSESVANRTRGVQQLVFVMFAVIALVELVQAARGHRTPLHSWAVLGGAVAAFGAPLVVPPLRRPLIALAFLLAAVWLVTFFKGI